MRNALLIRNQFCSFLPSVCACVRTYYIVCAVKMKNSHGYDGTSTEVLKLRAYICHLL